jgi:hypothetical protein
MQHRSLIVIAAIAGLGLAACGDDGLTATLTSPTDGAPVAGGVALAMTADGVTIEPAGEVRSGYGHFHLIADAGCTEQGTGIGKDADHLHFGKGQTDGMIYLEPGEHQLCLQVGDGAHAALDITDTVKVDVGVTSVEQWCAVVGEIDSMFETADISDDFAVSRVNYENIRRLVAQAAAGIEYVDAAATDDISTSLGFAHDLSAALAGADSPESAATAAEQVYEGLSEEGASEALPGSEWIRDTCGVDIDG